MLLGRPCLLASSLPPTCLLYPSRVFCISMSNIRQRQWQCPGRVPESAHPALNNSSYASQTCSFSRPCPVVGLGCGEQKSDVFLLIHPARSVSRWLPGSFRYNLLQCAGREGARESVGQAANANSGREMPPRANGPLSGLSPGLLGARSSLDWAPAPGSSPSAAPSATGCGHRRFCVPPRCPSATSQEADPRISSSFQLGPFVMNNGWLWLCEDPRGSACHRGIPRLPLSSVMSHRCPWPWGAFCKHQ